MKGTIRILAGILTVTVCMISVQTAAPGSTASAAVDPATLTPLSSYPGVKTFDFSEDSCREDIPESQMVDPEYSIRLEKNVPDEYFGAVVSQVTDSVTGESVSGIMLAKNGVKGQCGCIYEKMFQYRDKWVDVKTTYMDWSVYLTRLAFMAGGFANHRWKSTWWVEMKHEFFISGTDTPINVKAYLEYGDVDNSQGIYIDTSEVNDLWANSGGTTIGYKSIPGGVTYAQNSRASYVVDRDMLCIQSMIDDDISTESEEGYSADTAAQTCFAFTFSGSALHTCLVDDDSQGFNVLNVSGSKNIPSAFPEKQSCLVAKTVSDDDESDSVSNSVRGWEEWTYRISATVPLETEPGNFYDSFRVEDRIDSCLTVGSVQILRGDGEDVTGLFNISTEDNLIRAEAKNTQTQDFYGHEYFVCINVSINKTKEEMESEGKLDEDFRCIFVNTAEVYYTDGNGESSVGTNETETTVQYELEADIVITKKIKASDNYSPHGIPSFIFRLQGKTASGKDIILNGAVSIPPGETEGSVTFENVPEGKYNCTEYESLRFTAADPVSFTIDSTDTQRATVSNTKTDWADYSDSNMIVNRIGLN